MVRYTKETVLVRLCVRTENYSASPYATSSSSHNLATDPRTPGKRFYRSKVYPRASRDSAARRVLDTWKKPCAPKS